MMKADQGRIQGRKTEDKVRLGGEWWKDIERIKEGYRKV